MIRIFLSLSIVSNLLLIAAFGLGWMIGDPTQPDRAVQAMVANHFLVALGALVFAVLVHAIVLTYFMGTGRWIEETSAAYKLPPDAHAANRALKYRTLPAMVLCIVLLVLTGAFGGAADPASPVRFQGWFGFSPATIHFLIASATLAINMLVNLWEYQAIESNGRLVLGVLEDVRRIRIERGLPV